jgi:hypothetical protein
MKQIACIVSGGQTGVDRAALDWAIARGIAYRGWCPKGGWAEDMPEAPGLLADYPNLRETRSADPKERTEWNVRDSDATLVLLPSAPEVSPGTRFTLACAEKQEKPLLVVDPNDSMALDAILGWLRDNPNIRVLNIAGPRKSEAPGIYGASIALLSRL